MSAESIVYSALTASSSLMAYVTDVVSPPEYRVFVEAADQTASFPMIVYSRVASEATKNLNGSSGITRTIIQVDCWAKSLVTARAMADIVEPLLFGNFATFKGIKQDSRNLFEEQPRCFAVSQDFAIWA